MTVSGSKLILICLAFAKGVGAMPDYSELASENFEVRHKIQLELEKWVREDPRFAMATLLPKLRETAEPEIRNRLAGLLREGFDMVPKGFIGIGYQEIELEDGGTGILVSDVRPDSGALRAGLIAGDVIVKVNGWLIDSEFVTDGKGIREGFATLVQSYHAGEVMELEILRSGDVVAKSLTLGELPPLAERQAVLDPQLQFRFNPGLDPFRAGGLEGAEKAEREARFERWLKRNTSDETN